MVAVLTFVVVTLVTAIDPVGLLGALIVAGLTHQIADRGNRYVTMFLGAVAITVVLAAASWHLATLDGNPRFRFRWAETAAASLLQIGLISAAIRGWRRRAQDA